MNTDLDISTRIREDIIDGTLPFGERVTIAELAQRYDVSQMPIRTALSQLQGEGLLTVSSTGRTSIRNFDRKQIANIFDLRGAVEVLLIRAAATQMSKGDFVELETAQWVLEETVARQDYPAVHLANRRFHSIIAKAANNHDAVEVLNRHFYLIAALWRRVSYGPDRFNGVISDHRAILDAIRVGDAQAATAIAHAHVIKAKLKMIAAFDATFPPKNESKLVANKRGNKNID